MDISKIFTVVEILLLFFLVAYFLKRKEDKITKAWQGTWFKRSPFTGRWFPATWQGYLISFLFVVGAVFIALSSFWVVPLFLLLFLLYIFIGYKKSR
jgi:hypothetical protein